MLLYDSLSKTKKKLRPPGRQPVKIYTCGPSVYAYSHIGNFRTYLFEDILVRYLRYRGYRVRRVMNITDIEDKAIGEARRENRTLIEVQKDKIRQFFEDFRSLGMAMPERIAKASDHVPQAIKLIERICGNAYCRIEEDGVYFDIRKYANYGMLKELSSRKYFGPAHLDDYAKEGLWDFRLWKRWTRGDGEVKWKSPFGEGRPGWHIECSAITMHYLGEQIDIHCGGEDNIYPHHENEIAQCESATGKKFAGFWMHAKHLTVNGKKMSKRKDNVLYVKDLVRHGMNPKCLRFYLICEKYRQGMDVESGELGKKTCACGNARKLIGKLRRIRGGRNVGIGRKIAQGLIEGFEGAMDNDLNTKLAFKRIFREFRKIDAISDGLKERDAQEILKAIEKINSVLGVF